MLRSFPFMALAVLVYAAVVAVMGQPLAGEAANLALPSGARMVLSVSDLLLAAATIVLFFEMMNEASAKTNSILNHGLSMLVFMGGFVVFLMLPAFGTGTFLIIVLMCLVDVIAGYSISILTARRDMTFDRQD